jgi:hypothetical protein
MEEASQTGVDDEDSKISQRIEDRPPPISITTQIYLLNFKGEMNFIAKSSFELRNTKKEQVLFQGKWRTI